MACLKPMKTSLAFCVVILLSAHFSMAARQVLLKIVGSIENHILTTRDVEACNIVDRLLYNEGPYSPLKYGTEEFASTLNRLLIEWMVRDEADIFGVAKVSDSEVDETYNSVRTKIRNHPVVKKRWQALGISDLHLKEMISRKLRANRFIKYKSNSSYVQVSDDEAREYFNKNELKFGTTDFESFKGNIKKYLGRKNAEDRLRDWLEILRKKHKVKNMISGAQIGDTQTSHSN
jgi:hypothetical protein